ncbi:ParB/RepB/Spo0J family partition protein [Vibrio parahaemolyticus]|uniref:ParB/RepB/Spo0J family partition protein n=1 Tax=Vibrio parahaemolyticus TaxID=670 RepID=UPI0019357E31|nr:ParB/RepB/Spo0J family partition protein [Vibrio parahaemolyticus]QQD06592.1 ParB N-terminal domain-containing protein [Vibrio parahaemolyticus]
MNAMTQTLTHSNPQDATSVSSLDSQATAQNDISIMMLPVSVLVVSDLNVRKSKATKADDESLQASIVAHGIIQNLVALPMNEAGLYPIISGGRRLTALNALVEQTQITNDYLVPVKVLTEDEAKIYATEISLTENVTRAAMHPVDEFEAYSKMITEGATVEAVAQRFGKTQLYVHQRMKLAAVIPAVLEAYREGKVTLERVMIFTVASPEHQAEVWEQIQEHSWYNDNQVRHMLKKEALEATSALVKYVGQEEYEKQGGLVTSDLFSDKVYFEDRSLMESLATAKMQIEADKLMEQGWKWTEILLQRTHDESRGYLELIANQGKYKKAEKALAGCILALGYNGEVHIIKGLVAKSERKALKALQAGNSKNTTSESDNHTQSDTVAPETSYSNALTEDLKAHRLAMAKHALALNSELALDALHFSLCVRAQGIYASTPIDMTLNRSFVEPKQGDFSENHALERMEQHKNSLDMSWLEKMDTQERFKAFVELDPEEKQKQVAFATSLMLIPSLVGDSRNGFEFLYQELGFNAADYWRPTTDSFLKRIDKEALIDIARPVMSEEWLQSAQSLKKGDLVQQLNIWLSGGDDALTKKQKAHFAKWMPQGF